MPEPIARDTGASRTFPYSRDVLAEVVIYHYKDRIEGCRCGWSELGKCHGQHVADVYEASVAARVDAAPPEACSTCGLSFESQPCSRNPETGVGGHTSGGGCASAKTDSATSDADS